MKKAHRVIIRNNKGIFVEETRFSDGIMYKQNRSYDLEMSLDCFIGRLQITKQQAIIQDFKVMYDVIDYNTLWQTV